MVFEHINPKATGKVYENEKRIDKKRLWNRLDKQANVFSPICSIHTVSFLLGHNADAAQTLIVLFPILISLDVLKKINNTIVFQ